VFYVINFVFSPLPDTSGYQQSEPANVADVGWGWDAYAKAHSLQLNPPYRLAFLCVLCAFVVNRIAFLHGGGTNRAIRRISVISAALAETSADTKGQFGGLSRASRQTIRRNICTICKSCAYCESCAIYNR
jgi:hypothetical protein